MSTDTPERSPRWLSWVRSGIGVVILAVLLLTLGAQPFVAALTGVTGWALLAALLVTLVTTACCAWRWSAVAAGVGVPIRPGAAVLAYYRSQFLNSVLPGGVLGDVHRAVRHGVDTHRMGRGVRSVVWERTLGQVVQVVLTVVVLTLLPSPIRGWAGAGLATLVIVAVVLALILRSRSLPRRLRPVRAVVDEGHRILRRRRVALGIVLVSCVAVLGHVVVFLIAMAAAGVEVTAGSGVALALIVLLGAAIPTNIAGWGPREGVAAWAFEVVGLGAATGLSVAVLYGVLALVATLPGALLLIVGGTGARTSPGSDPGLTPPLRKNLSRCEGGAR